MRKLILQAVLLLACLYTKAAITPVSDTIIHAIDGSINEWKIDSFETDKDTQMQYGADHDANYLFLAIKIADQRTQMKMMTRGMTLYLDRKGKHRETTGINFPLQQDMSAMRTAFTGNGDNKTAPDPKAMREILSKNMLLMKTFGLEDREDRTQMIVDENGISVSYDWDEANNMYVEYLIPLKFLGQDKDLAGKPISIGWQLVDKSTTANGSGSSTQTMSSSSAIVAVPSTGGSTGGGGRNGGSRTIARLPSAGSGFQGSTNGSNEHIFWTKHTLNF